MNIKPVFTCPLGSKCTEIKDGTMYRCMWYMDVSGTNVQTGEPEVSSECAIVWGPLLTIKQLQLTAGVQQATESFRNEMVDINKNANVNVALALQAHMLELAHETGQSN